MTKYRKGLALLAIMLASVHFLLAQVKEKKNTFGILVGGVASNVSEYEAQTRIGLIGGLYWETRLSNRFSLMSNVLYSQRGEIGKDNIRDIKMDYINMPVMIKFTLFNKLGISSGINSDLLLRIVSMDMEKSDFKKTDWAVPVGISLDLTRNIQLSAIYNHGLTNITAYNNTELKNNWGSMTLSYLFRK